MSHCIFSKNALFGIKGMQTAIKIGFGKPYNPRFPMEFEAFFKKMGWPITQQSKGVGEDLTTVGF